MNLFNQSIFENKEAADLPLLYETGGLPALVTGLSPVHRAQLAAALYEKLELPLFVICPDEASADILRQDLMSLTGEPVEFLNSRDFSFYTVLAASREAEQKRIHTLSQLVKGQVRLCVATVSALLQRGIPPETLQKAEFTVSDSTPCPPDDLEQALLRNGYTRTEQVEGVGQYARRGYIFDFFSPMYPQPIRIEFWGDDVDSMGFFDVSSQRRTEAVSSVTVLPALETLVSLGKKNPEELSRQLDTQAEKLEKRKNAEPLRDLAAAMRQDAEKLRCGIRLTDADRYISLIYDAAYGVDYIPEDALVFFDQPGRCAEQARAYIRILGEDVAALIEKGSLALKPEVFRLDWEPLCARLAAFPVYMSDSFTVGRYPLNPKSLCSIPAKQLPSYAGSVSTALEDVELYRKANYRVLVLAGDLRRGEVLQSYFAENGVRAQLCEKLSRLPEQGECMIAVGALSAGIEYPGIRLAVIADSQLRQAREPRRKPLKKLPANQQRLVSYADLSVGDYVVHDTYGIGRFVGIERMRVDGNDKDYVKLSYAGGDTVYVPALQLDSVTKYLGASEDKPVKLSKLGGTEWVKTRTKAKGAAQKMAKKLIALYAERLRLPGHAFSEDTVWQRDFEYNFGYNETDDQLRCIEEIKQDMESAAPMDRLLCGDVGFGKTEVALRAAMKCILDGKQAALLCPTTVLAQQHYQTAIQRFFGFPVTVGVLSRFRSPSQISETLKSIENGKCDLVIGTHRLLQKDVKFKELGLLIVDEEQRFGVAHKEHIKEMSRGVDVLTLSATPIPRTLNMALMGIRDISSIHEPPQDRLPVQTFVMEHDWGILTDAIARELARGGQVYYLHNRIGDIDKVASTIREKLRPVCGEVAVDIAHGQMDKEYLASVMEKVSGGSVQVLVCTTIIETGIDIPNVNTLIIDDADKLGLAQLHQIRGRVGRSTRRASAYLTFKPDKVLTEDAEKRLNAIRDYAEFGSGFKIAMRDLEIRGAGDLLGAEQSGHILSVGYDMYMKLLEEAVLEERGIKPEKRAECSADLAVAANIPESYIRSSEQRMDIYRRIAFIRTEEQADDLTDELIDRYGDPPPGVNTLIHVSLLRGEAGRAGIAEISQKGESILFVLEDFNVSRLRRMSGKPEFTRRLWIENEGKSRVGMIMKNKKRAIDEARSFVSAWAEMQNL